MKAPAMTAWGRGLRVSVFLLLLSGCMEVGGDVIPNDASPVPPDAGSFTMYARYDSIRSFGGGGGVFPVALHPAEDFSGCARLTVDAHPALGAWLDRRILDERDSVAELRLRPCSGIGEGLYPVLIRAEHADTVRVLELGVRIVDWSATPGSTPMDMLAPFLAWLGSEHPEVGNVLRLPAYCYGTYPEILIVEHWTFLSAEWEIRLCFHVMIPPDDWSMLMLRRTGTVTPLLAARRESNGEITEIPVDEYPTQYGY